MTKKQLFVTACCALAVPLVLFAYLGRYTRYLADDFCTSAAALQYGLVGSVIHLYTSYAGQFTNWTLKGLVSTIGSGMVTVLPALILVLWVGAAVWTTYQFCRLLNIRNAGWIVPLLGLALVYAVFAGAPNIIQSLFWMGASIPYTLPLAVLIFYLGLVVYNVRLHPDGRFPAWLYVATAVMMFIAGGTSEVYVLFQTAVLGLGLVGIAMLSPTLLRRSGIRLLGVAIVFSILAFLVLLASPGNSVRQASFGETLPLVEILLRTLRVTASFFASAIGLFSPVPLFLVLMLSVLVMLRLAEFEQPIPVTPRRARRFLMVSGAVAIILMLVVIGAPIYATSVAPAPRVYLAAHLVMVVTAGVWGCIIGLDLRRRRTNTGARIGAGVWIVLGLLLLVGPLATTWQTLNRVPDFSAFAAEWDQRDQDIRAASVNGVQNVSTESFSTDLAELAALDTIGDDPDGWVNKCAASYYGVESIVAYAG